MAPTLHQALFIAPVTASNRLLDHVYNLANTTEDVFSHMLQTFLSAPC